MEYTLVCGTLHSIVPSLTSKPTIFPVNEVTRIFLPLWLINSGEQYAEPSPVAFDFHNSLPEFKSNATIETSVPPGVKKTLLSKITGASTIPHFGVREPYFVAISTDHTLLPVAASKQRASP